MKSLNSRGVANVAELSWFIAGSTSACFPLGGGVIFVGSTDSTADPSKDMSRDMSALRFGSMHYPRAAGGERGRGGRFGARVCPGPAPPSVGRSLVFPRVVARSFAMQRVRRGGLLCLGGPIKTDDDIVRFVAAATTVSSCC